MSRGIETENHGFLPDFGLGYRPDMIELGALPSIEFDRFCEYGTRTLINILIHPETSNEIKEHLRLRVAFHSGRQAQASVRMMFPKDDSIPIEHIQQLRTALADQENVPTKRYEENPFSYSGGKVIISNFYHVDPNEFIDFVTNTLGGGLFGWNQVTVPERAKEAFRELITQMGISHNDLYV